MEVKGETYCLRSLKNHFTIPMEFLIKSSQESVFVVLLERSTKTIQ